VVDGVLARLEGQDGQTAQEDGAEEDVQATQRSPGGMRDCASVTVSAFIGVGVSRRGRVVVMSLHQVGCRARLLSTILHGTARRPHGSRSGQNPTGPSHLR
jgi:hypothetical protein